MGQGLSRKQAKPSKQKAQGPVAILGSKAASETNTNRHNFHNNPRACMNSGKTPAGRAAASAYSLGHSNERWSIPLHQTDNTVSHSSILRSDSLDVHAHHRRPASVTSTSSLQHISERVPDHSSSLGSMSLTFYSSFHEDVAAVEVAKTLRRSISKRSQSRGVNMATRQATGTGGSDRTYHGHRSLRGPLTRARATLKGECGLSNSCSTLFVDQTVSHPDLDQVLRCAAIAIHMTFKKVLSSPIFPDFDPIFDEREHPLTNQQIPADYRTRLLSVMEVYDFLRAFFKAAVLKADVAIVTMVYITRLHNVGIVLQPVNWKRILLGTVMLASKVWDDQAVWNADYCTVLPDVSVDSMNQLERKVLELLTFNVSVSLSEYAQHYYELRMYGHKADVEEGIRVDRLTRQRATELEAMNFLYSAPPPPIRRTVSQERFVAAPAYLIVS